MAAGSDLGGWASAGEKARLSGSQPSAEHGQIVCLQKRTKGWTRLLEKDAESKCKTQGEGELFGTGELYKEFCDTVDGKAKTVPVSSISANERYLVSLDDEYWVHSTGVMSGRADGQTTPVRRDDLYQHTSLGAIQSQPPFTAHPLARTHKHIFWGRSGIGDSHSRSMSPCDMIRLAPVFIDRVPSRH